MKTYLSLMSDILKHGVDKGDRTGVGTRSLFGCQMKIDLQDGFPLLTTKKMFLRGVFVELIRLIRGETNIKYLVDRNIHIRDERPFQNYLKLNGLEDKFPKYSNEWLEEKKTFINKIKKKDFYDDFVQKYGDLGPVYGHQRRNFGGKIKFGTKERKDGHKDGVDQIVEVLQKIKDNPNDRRILVSAWNPQDLSKMLLPPCHMFFQFYVNSKKGVLDLQMYQRSADFFLGVPFNISSYSLLLTLFAKISDLKPGVFTHNLGDTHLYQNHFSQVEEQLSKKPFELPTISIKKDIFNLKDIEELEREDITLSGYKSHQTIKAPIAV